MKPIIKLIFSIYLCFTGYELSAQYRQYDNKAFLDGFKQKYEAVFSITPSNQLSPELPLTLSITYFVLTDAIKRDRLVHQITSLNENFSNRTFESSENQSRHYAQLATDTEIRFCANFDIVEAANVVKEEQIIELLEKYKEKTSNTIPIIILDLENGLSGQLKTYKLAEEIDVIVLDKDYLSNSDTRNYSQGKTLTHLLGAYLGLGELWGCVDDGIFDTPIHSVQHFDQVGSLSSCYNYEMYTMPQNFMYNTFDEHQNMFTPGQKMKMLFVVNNIRKNLIETNSCKNP